MQERRTATALLVWLVAYPLILTLIEGLRADGGWTLDHVRAFGARPVRSGSRRIMPT